MSMQMPPEALNDYIQLMTGDARQRHANLLQMTTQTTNYIIIDALRPVPV